MPYHNFVIAINYYLDNGELAIIMAKTGGEIVKKIMWLVTVGILTALLLMSYVETVTAEQRATDTVQKESTESSKNANSVANQVDEAHDSQSTTPQVTSNQKVTKVAKINDGVQNWETASINTVAYVDLGNSRRLGYTFGKASTNRSDESGSKFELKPKANVFINNNGNIEAAFFGVKQGLITSFDYAIHPDRSNKNPLQLNESIGERFQSYRVYKGTTSDGSTALKVVGLVEVGNKTYEATLLIRPNPNKAVIQQELYLASTENTKHAAGIYLAKDLLVDNNDNIPVYAQGNNAGLYLQSKKYKVFINLKVPDGPQHYGVTSYLDSYSYALSPYKGTDFDSPGLENDNLKEGTVIFKKMDSTYSNKWSWQTFEPNTVYHYRSDIGLTESGAVSPDTMIKYTNKTSDNGENHVNDQLTIESMAHNNGYNSHWQGVTITSNVPKGLTIAPKSLKLKLADETIQTVDASHFDAQTGQLSVKLPKDLAENEWTSLLYDAQINKSGAGTTMTAKMTAKGENGFPNEASDDVQIPIQDQPTAIEKTVRNAEKPTGDYGATAEGTAKGRFDYRVVLTTNQTGGGLASGTLSDVLPKGLTLVPNSATIKYAQQATPDPVTAIEKINLKPMAAGETATLTYRAQVADTVDDGALLKNTAQVTGKEVNGTALTIDASASVKITKPKIGKVIFKYLDRATGQPIGDQQITITGPIGKRLSEVKSDEIQVSGGQNINRIRPAYIDSYVPVDFTADGNASVPTFDNHVRDVDPVFDETETVYLFRYEKQRLEIMAHPVKFSFGKFSNTQAERTYYLPTAKDQNGQKKPYSIGIADYWGINSWQLTVSQPEQFEGTYLDQDKKPQRTALDDARLIFNNIEFERTTTSGNSAPEKEISDFAKQKTLIPGAAPTTLVTYTKNGQYLDKDQNNADHQYDVPGYSEFEYRFGNQSNQDYSIALHVPRKTVRQKTTYKTKLVWHLTVAP